MTFGWEKAGIGASITFSKNAIIVSLGIGVAAVELDLGELNNSTVSYAFDLYEIAGHRDGCYVTLEYSIAGAVVKTETRKIPDCKEEKEQEKEQEESPPEGEDGLGGKTENIKLPGNLWDYGYFMIAHDYNNQSTNVSLYGLWLVVVDNGWTKTTGKIKVENNRVVGANTEHSWWRGYDRLYQPSSGTDYVVHSEGYPYEESGGHSYDSVNFDSVSPQQAYYGDIRKAGRRKYVCSVLVGPVGLCQKYISSIKYPYPTPHYFKGDSFGGYSDIFVDNSSLKLLDSFIEKRNPPQRGGGNGIQSQKTKNKRRKPMDERCCKMIEQIYDVLAVDEMIDEGFNIPKKWYAPEARGNERLDNYMQVQEYQMRMLDHYGIAPFVAEIADANLAVKGNQNLATQTVNGTDAVRQILQNTMKLEAGNEGNFTAMGAIMIALEQILQAVTTGTRVAQEIFQYLGIPVRSETFKIKLPFNTKALLKKIPQRQKKKGEKQLKPRYELNTTEKSSTLLPKMLTQNEKEYELEVYNDDYPNLMEQLNNNQINNNANR